MSVGEERLRLGLERKLIFENFCLMVPKPEIAAAFHRSLAEIDREIAFVAKKIREYRHRRCLRPSPEDGPLPPIPCETETEILVNREVLLWTLGFLGPQTLSSELIVPRLTLHKIETPGHLREAAHAIRTTIRDH